MDNRSEKMTLQQTERSKVADELKKRKASKENIDALKRYEEELNKKVIKNDLELRKDLEKEVSKIREENYRKEGNILKAELEKAFGTASQAVDTLGKTVSGATKALTSEIDKTLDNYVKNQQSMIAHLTGVSGASGSSVLSNLTNTLQKTLSATNLVKQENVFNNLVSYVKSGISYNVEQRAFLQTLADDIDLVFNTTNGSLAQLIRIQNQDSTANRLAIEYSLQKFLNQNYQTSEYIKNAFEDVSNSLLTAQSLMSSANAMNFEAAVQTQLGSMYSAGMNQSTITSIANALNALGSGDISNLGSGVSNLVLMAAARAGLDYGSLLNNGLTADNTTKLLNSLTDYMAEMNENSSNVVRSQLGQLFGVSITDLLAATNLRNTTGGASTDIYSTLFSDYSDFVPFTTGLKNTVSNMMFQFGTNIASNQGLYTAYEVTKLIANSGIGEILQQTGSATKAIPLQLAGIALSNAQLIPILASLFGSNGGIMDIASSISTASGGLRSIFDAMAGSSSAVVKTSNAGVSGSIYLSSTGTSDILFGSTSSLNELTSSVTTVEGDKVTLEDNVQYLRDDVAAILDILDTYMEIISDGITAMSLTSSPVATGVAYAVKGTLI